MDLFMFYAEYTDDDGLIQHFTDYFLVNDSVQRFFSIESDGKKHYFIPGYMRAHHGNSGGILSALDQLGWKEMTEGHVPEQVKTFVGRQDISSVVHSRWQVVAISERDLILLERFNLQERETSRLGRIFTSVWNRIFNPIPYVQW